VFARKLMVPNCTTYGSRDPVKRDCRPTPSYRHRLTSDNQAEDQSETTMTSDDNLTTRGHYARMTSVRYAVLVLVIVCGAAGNKRTMSDDEFHIASTARKEGAGRCLLPVIFVQKRIWVSRRCGWQSNGRVRCTMSRTSYV
jgi:hypothetical protein